MSEGNLDVQASQGAASEPSGLAIASLVLGILSLICMGFIAGIPGLICGHIARSQIKASNGRIGGNGMAVAGLILSYVGAAISLVCLLLFFILPMLMVLLPMLMLLFAAAGGASSH